MRRPWPTRGYGAKKKERKKERQKDRQTGATSTVLSSVNT
jgi:hypothetical protein